MRKTLLLVTAMTAITFGASVAQKAPSAPALENVPTLAESFRSALRTCGAFAFPQGERDAACGSLLLRSMQTFIDNAERCINDSSSKGARSTEASDSCMIATFALKELRANVAIALPKP